MRSATEIAFRLRQEATNAALWLRPPSFQSTAGHLNLPLGGDVAAAVRESDYAKEVRQLTEQIRGHQFPLLGLTIDTGPEIRWRRDYVNGKETAANYFRLIPYLDIERAGDHKIIWELNRHQHLVLLAQDYILDGSEQNLAQIYAQLESWQAENPFQSGINWASALEVAFRALSWLWIFHFVGDQMPPGLRGRFLETLFRHARHIENNLSYYFSPNTHLLGEGVALHALGRLFPEFRDLGAQVVAEQMDKQVHDDGSHFEQSSYYHLYALDMFLFHAVIEDVSDSYRAKLERMAEYLHSMMGPQRTLPLIGDDDGGRFFHPYGRRERFGRATMATCGIFLNRPEWIASRDDLYEQAAWWLGPRVFDHAEDASPAHISRLFGDIGIAVMAAGDRHIVVDAGPFGPWGSGHSHSDTLSLVVRAGDREFLIDPGTFTYVGAERNWFRGSIAHNTIRINGADQAVPAGPFRWTDQPSVRVLSWETNGEQDQLDAACSYRGFTHRRRVRFVKPDTIYVTDEISGPPGQHEVEQFWHPGSAEAERCLQVEGTPDRIDGWRSDAFGEKHQSTMLRVHRIGALPIKLEAKILLK